MSSFIFILMVLSCALAEETALTEASSPTPAQAAAARPVPADPPEIPPSVLRLFKIEDKTSDAYVFGASHAAIDAKNAAVAAIDGGHSALALKVLTAALKVMPHMDELRNLRNKALESAINITKKLEEDPNKNCSLILERYNFFKVISPDSLSQLKNIKCVPELSDKTIVPLNTDLFTIPEPKVIQELENAYKSDLSEALDFYIKKNTNFPYEEALKNSFALLFAHYGEDYSINCVDLALDANTVSDKEMKLKGTCTFNHNPQEVERSKAQYCSLFQDLFIVPKGEKVLKCDQADFVSFPISVPLLRTYKAAFETKAFEQGLPVYLVMQMNFRYKTKNRTVPLFVYHYPGSSTVTVLKSAGKRYLDSVNSVLELKSISRSELVDLQAITFQIDYKTTYAFYKDSFKEATIKELECLQQRSQCSEDGTLYSSIDKKWRKYVVDQEMKDALQ